MANEKVVDVGGIDFLFARRHPPPLVVSLFFFGEAGRLAHRCRDRAPAKDRQHGFLLLPWCVDVSYYASRGWSRWFPVAWWSWVGHSLSTTAGTPAFLARLSFVSPCSPSLVGKPDESFSSVATAESPRARWFA